jgi:hypothetical protein
VIDRAHRKKLHRRRSSLDSSHVTPATRPRESCRNPDHKQPPEHPGLRRPQRNRQPPTRSLGTNPDPQPGEARVSPRWSEDPEPTTIAPVDRRRGGFSPTRDVARLATAAPLRCEADRAVGGSNPQRITPDRQLRRSCVPNSDTQIPSPIEASEISFTDNMISRFRYSMELSQSFGNRLHPATGDHQKPALSLRNPWREEGWAGAGADS